MIANFLPIAVCLVVTGVCFAVVRYLTASPKTDSIPSPTAQQSTIERRISIGPALLGLVAGFALCLGLGVAYSILSVPAPNKTFDRVSDNYPRPAPNYAPYKPIGSTNRYSFLDYLSLRDGMSLSSVPFGRGEEIASSGAGDERIRMFQWTNPDGSGILATFVNDLLVSKVQNGLQ